jgi:hypothetical protein
LRKQHLVPFDPFVRFREYSNFRDAIRVAVDGDLSLLSKIMGTRQTHKVALLYSLFQEVGSLYTAKEISEKTHSAVARLCEVFGKKELLSNTLINY